MKVVSVKINSILGLDHLDIKPGSITELRGANGVGKTSALDAIRSALGSGHDATLLRNGADEGETILVLDDGTEIGKKITAEKSQTVVRHPVFGKISKPQTYLQKLADALSLNPIEFLTAKSDQRVDLLLKAIPLKVTADQLGFVPVQALNGIDLDGHALPVLAKISKAVYDFRTGVNRAAKEKRVTASQMAETLPQAPPEGDWGDALDQANQEYKDLQRATQARVNCIKSDAQTAKQALIELCATKVDAVKAEGYKKAAEIEADLQKEIDRLRKEAEERTEKIRIDSAVEVSRCTEERDKAVAVVEENREESLKAAEAEYKPKAAELNEKLGQARTMVEQHTKSESTRSFISQLNSEATKLETESEKLSSALDKIETLKTSLVQSLPISGMEIRDDEIYVDGVIWDRTNESKRIRLAIEIAKLRAGQLGLVLVDGLERLDPKSFEAFKKHAAKSGLQFVISRVTGDEKLTVSTEQEAVNE